MTIGSMGFCIWCKKMTKVTFYENDYSIEGYEVKEYEWEANGDWNEALLTVMTGIFQWAYANERTKPVLCKVNDEHQEAASFS